MKILYMMILILFAGCATTEHYGNVTEDAYYDAQESFLELERSCAEWGKLIVFPHKHSTRIRRGYTLEDLRTARCQP